MPTLKLTIAYDGTAYGGWQIQPNSNTIQAELERAIHRIVGYRVRTTASGRTDAGVHASGQVVSCSIDTSIPIANLLRAVNAHLPDDIRILQVEPAPTRFHAIRDATRKRYRYRIWNANVLDVFQRDFVWHLPIPLNLSAMRQAIQDVRGKHDFACFQAAGSPRKTTVRTMLDVGFDVHSVPGGQQVIIELEADGFLYNMARNIVGTMVWIGRERAAANWIPELIRAGDRRQAGMTAPAKGLMLIKVWYDHVDMPTSNGNHNQRGVVDPGPNSDEPNH